MRRCRGGVRLGVADACQQRCDGVAPAAPCVELRRDGRYRIPDFQFATWAVFVFQVWLLDFGRPLYTLYFSHRSSLSNLAMSDYVHIAYNFITAICLIKLQDSSKSHVSKTLQQILIISFVMGSSIHMVADAVQQRLLKAGAQFHLHVHQQPMLQNTQPSVMQSFHLLDYLDEHFGHKLWYTSLYSLFLLYFSSCFYHQRTPTRTPLHPPPSPHLPPSLGFSLLPYLGFSLLPTLVFSLLLLLSSLHEWYAVTEAQVFPFFCLSSAAMLGISLKQWRAGASIDSNGVFLLLRCLFTHLLIAVWVCVLWRDAGLREKYGSGWLYIPEPWSYASLHLLNQSDLM